MKKIALFLAVIMTISALTFTCSAEALKVSPKPDIKVTYGSGYTTVTITPASGTTFRYTTDGSKPTKKSAKYKKPLTLKKNTTLRVRSSKSGCKTTVYKFSIKVNTVSKADTELAKKFETAINGTKLSKPLVTGTELDNRIKEIFGKIINDDMTNYEKVQACYDWLVKNVEYDPKSAVTLVMKNDLMGLKSPSDYIIVEFALTAVNKRKGVCDDFAAAFFVMMQALGVDAVYCGGECKSAAGGYTGHSWVGIYTDNGEFYQFDAMLDSSAAKKNGLKTSHRYFARPEGDELYRNCEFVEFGNFEHR